MFNKIRWQSLLLACGVGAIMLYSQVTIVKEEQDQVYSKPYFKNASVHVLHVGDQNFATSMASHLNRTFEWIECAGYQYRLEEVIMPAAPEERPCIYTLKVEKILHVLNDIPLNDWLIFLDMDVQYQAASCHALERMLPRHSVKQSQPCEFIALHSGNTINSGVLIIQATTATRQLVKRWYEVEQEMALCMGPADQISLQEVMMETLLVNNYDGSCRPSPESLLVAANNTNDANIWETMNAANTCFRDTLPKGRQSVGNICLLRHGCQDPIPLQCHDCDNHHCSQDGKAIFYHDKAPPGPRPPL